MNSRKLLIFILTFSFLYGAFPSYYYKIKNIKAQKKAFVNILLPLIQKENQKIIQIRRKIIKIFNDPYYLLNKEKIVFLTKIAKEYKIKDINNKKEFLMKIDTVPISLALAQAAIESGWGKSRFVKEANNLFGHWEYSSKGLQPKSKYDHIKIEYSIKIFPSLESSIATYIRNLNRNPAYKEFRDIRYKYKSKNIPFTGIIAAKTMRLYSQKKDEYVKLLQKMITQHHWDRFDKNY